VVWFDAPVQLDHIVIAAHSLDAADRIAARAGLTARAGGRHPAQGTANALVALDGAYLEIVMVADAIAKASSVWAQFIAKRATADVALAAWCVAVDDLDAVCRRLGLVAADWSRERPDGGTLRWRLAGVEDAITDPLLPFFIDWQVPAAAHPAFGGVGRVEAIDLAGDRSRLADWLGGVPESVRVTAGDSAIRRVTLRTALGSVTLS
jgi:hypothetical protein